MESGKHPVAQWLDRATAAIRFGPDRKEVRAELEAHLEDKALDFQRIFPGLTEAEARERAVSEMGDPMEIGKELAKVHKPDGLWKQLLRDRSRCGSTTIPFGWRKRP